jgi:plastocyanin
MMHAFSLNGIVRRASAPMAAAAAAVLLVGGCGGSDSDGGGSEGQAGGPTTSTGTPAAVGVVLDVSGTEYTFAPATLKASAGPTTIRFTNKGVVEHDFVIKALGVKIVAQAGKSAAATVTLAPGTYKTFCSVAGHSQSGMQGTLTVS